MESITTDQAPASVGPYSQAIKVGNFLFCSGQIGIVPGTKEFAGDDIQRQARQAMKNITAVLDAACFRLDHIAKTTVFLADMRDFPAFNQIYAELLGPHKPARSTIQAASLPLGALVEIECVAVRE